MPASERTAPARIEQLRRRFPTEPEIDRFLTRKMKLRDGPGYAGHSLDELIAATTALIRSEHGEQVEISAARWLTGGASKLQVAFTLDWQPPNVKQRERTPMVLRMQPAESLVETSRRREFEIIRAMQGVVPVPPVYWVDAEPAHLPYPAIVYGFVPGVTKPRNAASQATGMGTWMAPEWRAALGPQFVQTLAGIHRRSLSDAGLTVFEVPAPGTASVERALNHWQRVWEEDHDEDIPLLRLAAAWLREHMPACARPVIVHGDYRVGNFLFTEHDRRISAVLDWEMARIGDHHFDLAWAANPAYGHRAEDGVTALVGGFMPEAEFYASYEQHAGLAVDPRTLHYYKIFSAWMQGVIALGTAWRVADGGKTHQDALVAWIIGIGPKLLAELCDLLEQA